MAPGAEHQVPAASAASVLYRILRPQILRLHLTIPQQELAPLQPGIAHEGIAVEGGIERGIGGQQSGVLKAPYAARPRDAVPGIQAVKPPSCVNVCPVT